MSSATRPRRLRQRVVYDGRVIRVELDDIRLSNGRTTTMEIVRHRGSVVLIPQPSARSVVLIRQYRHVIGRWIWELPAGSIEAGERPAHCARRECAEEIGLTPGRVERLAAYYPTPGFCDEHMAFYRCTQLRPPRRPVEGDEDEQIEPRTYSLAEARSLITRGRIVDMKTVVGLGLIDL